MDSSNRINKIFIAAVGCFSQFLALFKLLFGTPQMMIVESIKDDEVFTRDSADKGNRKKLLRTLSRVKNIDGEDEEFADQKYGDLSPKVGL